MRVLYRVLSVVRVLYWFVFRPQTTGVKCVVECDGEWLMIRNSYGKGHWTLPGGAVGRREAPADAARREVAEEVGVSLASVRPIGSYFSDKQYKRDTVHCFHALVDTRDHEIDGREIAEAAWMPPDAIPAFHSGAVDCVIGMLAR